MESFMKNTAIVVLINSSINAAREGKKLTLTQRAITHALRAWVYTPEECIHSVSTLETLNDDVRYILASLRLWKYTSRIKTVGKLPSNIRIGSTMWTVSTMPL